MLKAMENGVCVLQRKLKRDVTSLIDGTVCREIVEIYKGEPFIMLKALPISSDRWQIKGQNVTGAIFQTQISLLDIDINETALYNSIIKKLEKGQLLYESDSKVVTKVDHSEKEVGTVFVFRNEQEVRIEKVLPRSCSYLTSLKGQITNIPLSNNAINHIKSFVLNYSILLTKVKDQEEESKMKNSKSLISEDREFLGLDDQYIGTPKRLGDLYSFYQNPKNQTRKFMDSVGVVYSYDPETMEIIRRIKGERENLTELSQTSFTTKQLMQTVITPIQLPTQMTQAEIEDELGYSIVIIK